MKTNWKWIESNLKAVNVTWLEINSGLKPKRISDVKRGKSSLNDDELRRVTKTIKGIAK